MLLHFHSDVIVVDQILYLFRITVLIVARKSFLNNKSIIFICYFVIWLQHNNERIISNYVHGISKIAEDGEPYL